jgi:hypothetical protein
MHLNKRKPTLLAALIGSWVGALPARVLSITPLKRGRSCRDRGVRGLPVSRRNIHDGNRIAIRRGLFGTATFKCVSLWVDDNASTHQVINIGIKRSRHVI